MAKKLINKSVSLAVALNSHQGKEAFGKQFILIGKSRLFRWEASKISCKFQLKIL